VPAIARLAQFRGETFVLAEEKRNAARAGQDLLPGHEIESGELAVAEFPDGTRLELAGPSAVRLNQGPAGRQIVLARGTVLAEVARQPADRPTVFVTPHAEVTILGTSLRVETGPEGSEILVIQGRVRLMPRAGGNTADLEGGQIAWVPAAGGLRIGRPQTLSFDAVETAGISGLRELWDTPVVLAENGTVQDVDKGSYGKAASAVWKAGKPGALAFDAVHRSLLVRFPGAAERIAAELRKGQRVVKAEIILPFRSTELWPLGYKEPSGLSFLGDLWAKTPPNWHAAAWALRRPWRADPSSGPTFNSSANGSSFWARFGAQDPEKDRFPLQFGPAEVSQRNPEGRLNVTAMLNDPQFGATLGERLYALGELGFIIRKQEVYDASYWRGGYEWGTASGPRGILIKAPKLAVELAPGPKPSAETPKAGPRPPAGGKPTAVMPTPAQFQEFAARNAFRKPDWMPEWQWKRISEMAALGGATKYPETYEAYARWIDDMLGVPPRQWEGFLAAERCQQYMRYGDTWPEPVRDHWKLYWWAWLMPDRDIKDLVQGYIGANEARAYYEKTKDWRGNFSVYRTYCWNMGTMNFNHWASTGTLLGGAILDSDKMMADGRHGLEHFPLRLWCWFDGSTQESIDHYYFAISLKDQKVFADFGPTHADRLMGMSILAKSVDELVAAYHPGLRRFVSSSGRTGIAYVWVQQDGTKHILHTLSRKGALTDLGNRIFGGMQALGHDAEPGMIAEQTLNGPWAPEWIANAVDDKPLPFESTSTYKQWGAYSATPLWRRTYLGKHYGMASQDVAAGNETVPVMAQWRRSEKVVDRMQEVGTLLARCGINRTEFLDSLYHGTQGRNPNGSVGTQSGPLVTMQHRNKMILLGSPNPRFDAGGGRPVPNEIRSLQTSIALCNFEEPPTWEIHVDEQRVGPLPVKARFKQRITIRDGVSYIGIIPIPAADLGRNDEVVLWGPGEMTEMQGGGKGRVEVVIDAYMYKQEAPLNKGEAGDGGKVDLAYAGFVVEMGDASEYRSFADFQKHMKESSLDAPWDAAKKTLNVAYRSGKDVLECAYRPAYRGGPTDQCFPVRRVNGQWPYLAKDMERETSLAVMGRSGKLEKNGAVLTCEPGRMAYIETDPITGTTVGYNPLPDPTAWALRAAGGATVQANGKVGLLRVAVCPKLNRAWVDHAFTPEMREKGKGTLATALSISGLGGTPVVVFNGQTFDKCSGTIPLDLPERKPERWAGGISIAAGLPDKSNGKGGGSAATPPAAVPAEVLAAWDAKLRARIAEEVKAGRPPAFRFSMFPDQESAVAAIDAKGGMKVRSGGAEMAVEWPTLTMADKKSLSADLAGGGKPEDCALAAFYHLAGGSANEGKKYLERAGPAGDPVREALK
jgi:hypothetical protein